MHKARSSRILIPFAICTLQFSILNVLILHAQTLEFDMGTAKSVTRQGFVQITKDSLYAPGVKYGWADTNGLRHDDYAPTAIRRAIGGQDSEVLRVFANDLNRDFVWSETPHVFQVDIPDGKYLVYMLFGATPPAFNPPFFDTSIEIEGKPIDAVLLPQVNIFEHRRYAVEVNDRQLNIRFSTRWIGWLVNAIIIYPADSLDAFEKEVDEIKEETEFLPKALQGNWRLLERPRDKYRGRAAETSRMDKERGYALFARDYCDSVYPNSRLVESEKITDIKNSEKLATFAAQGEYEPLTFSIYPLKDIRGLRMSPSTLTAPKGNQLSGENIDLGVVKYRKTKIRVDAFRQKGYYKLVPETIAPFESLNIPRNQVTRFWVTFRVPEETKSGLYAGAIRISGENVESVEVPLKLRVLPFRLKSSPRRFYGFYWTPPLRSLKTYTALTAKDGGSKYKDKIQDFLTQRTLLQLADMRLHGINTATCHIDFSVVDGKVVVDFEMFEKILTLRKKVGMLNPMVWSFDCAPLAEALGEELDLSGATPIEAPPKFYELLKELVKTVETKRREKGWPTIIYAPIHEPVSPYLSAFAMKLLRTVREAGEDLGPPAKLKTFLVCVEKSIKLPGHFADIGCYISNEDHLIYYNERKIATNPKRLPSLFWLYPMELTLRSGVSAARSRFLYGFYGWKVRLDGYNAYIYQNQVGDPFNDFDQANRGEGVTYPGPGGPVPTVVWEGIREGIDDARYLYTLEKLVDEAAKERDPTLKLLVNQVRKEWPDSPGMIGMKAQIPYRLKFVKRFTEKWEPDPKSVTARWPNDTMQKYRWRIAFLITEILRAREGLPALERPARIAKLPPVNIKFRTGITLDWPAIPCLSAPFVDTPPRIDGKLDDACWAKAAKIDNLIDSKTDKPADPPTEVYIVQDYDRFYVAFKCYEPNMELAKNAKYTTPRDRLPRGKKDQPVWEDECVEVLIDANHDHRTYAQVAVNSAGVRSDYVWQPAPTSDWGSHSTVKSLIGKDAWYVEVQIPIVMPQKKKRKGQKRSKPYNLGADNQIWGVNFARYRHAQGTDYSSWSLTDGTGVTKPNLFGHVFFKNPTVYIEDVNFQMWRLGNNSFRGKLVNAEADRKTLYAEQVIFFRKFRGRGSARVKYRPFALAEDSSRWVTFPFRLRNIGPFGFIFTLFEQGGYPLFRIRRQNLEVPPIMECYVDSHYVTTRDKAVKGELTINLRKSEWESRQLKVALRKPGVTGSYRTTIEELESRHIPFEIDASALEDGEYSLQFTLQKQRRKRGERSENKTVRFVKLGHFLDVQN